MEYTVERGREKGGGRKGNVGREDESKREREIERGRGGRERKSVGVKGR